MLLQGSISPPTVLEDLDIKLITISVEPYLLTILLKHPELETLVQFVFLDLPQLEELLLAGVYLVEELHDAGDAGLEVRVEGHVAGRTVPPAVAAVVTVSTLTT